MCGTVALQVQEKKGVEKLKRRLCVCTCVCVYACVCETEVRFKLPAGNAWHSTHTHVHTHIHTHIYTRTHTGQQHVMLLFTQCCTVSRQTKKSHTHAKWPLVRRSESVACRGLPVKLTTHSEQGQTPYTRQSSTHSEQGQTPYTRQLFTHSEQGQTPYTRQSSTHSEQGQTPYTRQS